MADWEVNLSDHARRDFENILNWTSQSFGDQQAGRYSRAIAAAIRRLRIGPDAPGARQRNDVMPGLRTLHLRSSRSRARHLLVYGVVKTGEIRIFRILHDSMDLPRHLPQES